MLSYQRPDLRVLVVDDHELTRFSLKVALSRHKNLQLVGLADNGEEAIEMARNYLPDVIIIDVQMPLMDGVTASSQIKSFNPSTQIIVYSSLEEQQLENISKHPCIDSYCHKEADTEFLIDLINELGQEALSQKSA